MKKQVLFIFTLVLWAFSMSASAAGKQRKAESIRRAVQKYVQSPELIRDMENVSVYAGRQNGYVVVSKSEGMPEILGYGSAKLNAKDMPEGMKWLIGYYNSIAEAVDAGKMNAPRAVKPAHAIEPLIKTTWDQDAPFWDMLPAVENEKTGKKDTVAVGCVATAVSQIMYYHKWPERGQGSVKWDAGALGNMEADFSNSVYDWNNMLLTYGKEHKESKVATDAVALLCRDVGYACNSKYGTVDVGGTGSDAPYAAYALVHNFGYDKGIHIGIASDYSEEEWAAILCEELEAGRPVQYYGSSVDNVLSPSTHAFILDGVNEEGLYHVNWGWRGRSNDYFLISALNPDDPGIGSGSGGLDDGYIYFQEAILGIQKPVEGSVYRPYTVETYKCKPLNFAEDGSFTDVCFKIRNLGYDTFEGYFTCKPVNAETGEEIDIVLFKSDNVQIQRNKWMDFTDNTCRIKYSGVVPDGKYYFRIYTTDKNGYTTHVHLADSKLSEMVEVRDNKFYSVSNGIEIRNIKYTDLVTEGIPASFCIEYDIVNNSDTPVEAKTIKLQITTDMYLVTLDQPGMIEPGATIHNKTPIIELWGDSEIQIYFYNEKNGFRYYATPVMPIDEFFEIAGIAPVVVDAASDAPSYRVSGIPAKGNVKGIVISNGKKTLK